MERELKEEGRREERANTDRERERAEMAEERAGKAEELADKAQNELKAAKAEVEELKARLARVEKLNRQYVMTSGFVGSWIYLYTTDRNKSNGNRDYRIQKEVIKWIITQFM